MAKKDNLNDSRGAIISKETYVEPQELNTRELGSYTPLTGNFSSDFGSSQYDDLSLESEYINKYKDEVRAYSQDNWDKAGNAVGRFAGRAITSAAELGGNVYGLAKLGVELNMDPLNRAMYKKENGTMEGYKEPTWATIFDNEVTRGLDNMDSTIKEWLPQYKTENYKNANWYEKLGYANFYFDELADAAGFAVGSTIGAGAYSKLTGNMFKLAKAGQVEELNSLMKESKALYEAGKDVMSVSKKIDVAASKIKAINGIDKAFLMTVSGVSESGQEARSTGDAFEKSMIDELTVDKLTGQKFRDLTPEEADKISSLKDDAMKSSFLMNMLVTGPTSMLVNNSAIKKMAGLKGAAAESKMIKPNLNYSALETYSVKEASKIGQFAASTGRALKSNSLESIQEMYQTGLQKAEEDYYNAKYKGKEGFDQFLKSATVGLNEAFSNEGLSAALSGFLTPGVSNTLTTRGGNIKDAIAQFSNQKKSDLSFAALLNKNSSKATFKSLYDASTRHQEFSNQLDNAIENSDDFETKNQMHNIMTNLVSSRIKSGRFEDLQKDLDYFKTLPSDQFEEMFGVKLDASKMETVVGFVQNKIDQANEIKKTNDNIETVFGGTVSEANKERLLHATLAIKDSKERGVDIAREVLKTVHDTYKNANASDFRTQLSVLEKDYSRLNDVEKLAYRDSVLASELTPLDQKGVIDQLNDIDKLKGRGEAYVNLYNELVNPENQKKNDIVDSKIENKSNLKTAGVSQDEDEDYSPQDDEDGSDIDAILARSSSKKAQAGPEIGDSIVVKHNGVSRQAEVINVNKNEDGTVESVDYEVPSDKAEGEVETEEEAAARFGNSPIFKKQAADESKDDASQDGQGAVDLSTTPDVDKGQEFEKFGEVVSVEADKDKKKSFIKRVIDAIKSLVKNNEDIDNHITLKVVEVTDSKGSKHKNVGIFLDGNNVGFVNALATDPFTINLIKTVKASPAKTFTTKDLGIRFGLTDGSLDLVPNGQQQPLIKDLNIDLSLTGGQHLIYDFKARQEGEYTTGSFIGDIDESLFQPGVEIDEKSIPNDLGRYVLVIPMDNGSVRYVRVRPAKLDQLSDSATNKVFEKIRDKAADVKASKEVDRNDISNFNSELNEGFFIAVDSKLKIDGVNYDSFAVSLAITAGNEKGDGKGKVRVTLEGFINGNNKSKVVKSVFVNMSNITSIDALLAAANKELGLKLSRADFKTSISPKNAVDEMTSAVSVDVVKSQQLVFAKVSATSSVNNTAKSDIDNQDGVKTGTYPSDAMIAKGVKLGFSKENIVDMSVEEREMVKSATSKDDIKDLLDKYVKTAEMFKESFGDFTIFEGNDGTYDVVDNSEDGEGVIADYVKTKEEAINIAKEADIEKRSNPTKAKQSESVAADLRIQISNLLKKKETLEKDVNSNPKEIRALEKEITAVRKKLIEAELNEPKGSSAFKMEDTDGIPLSQEEIDEVRAMLPSFIEIKDISKVINNLKANKIPLGVFKDGLIYLNKNTATTGTAYHEAFHAVFRLLLTEQEIQKYLAEAQKEYISKHGSNALNQLKKDIQRLRMISAEYAALSLEDLEDLVYEEHMAERWEGFKKDEKAKGPFRRLFIIIKNLFKMFQYHSEPLDALFGKISNKAFSTSTKKSNRFDLKIGMAVYKLIPAGTEEVYDELTGKSSLQPISHTQKKSDKLISTFAARINKAIRGEYGVELSKMSKDQLFEYFVNERMSQLESVDFDNYAESIKAKSLEAYRKINQEANKELNTYEDDQYKGVLKEQVMSRLKSLNYEPIDDQAEQVNENNDVKEKFSSQDAWLSGGHDSLPKIIKEYISFSTYMEYDPIIGKEVEVAVDSVTAYNGLTRVLADVPKSGMINKLQSVAEYNPNIKAVLDRLMEDTGMVVNEDNTISQPTKNFNDYQMFLNAFDGSLTTQLFTLVDEKKNFLVASANTNNPKKLSVENWKSSINYMMSSVGVTKQEIANRMNLVVKEMNNGSKSKMNATQLKDKVNKLKDLFDSTGIKLSKGYIEYSLLAAKVENGIELTKKQQLTYDMNKDFMPFKTSLFKGEGSFSGLAKMINDGKDVFSSDERVGAKGDIEALAEANGMFDETIGNASFKNAEGKSVYEIIKSSYVLSQAKKMNSETYLKQLESGKDKNNDLNDRNYKFIKNNYLLKNHRDLVKKLKINIIDGLRHEDEDSGVVFGDYDGRTYLAQSLAMFGTASADKKTAKYIFRQNEASNTAYVAELPFMKMSEKGKANSTAVDILFNNFSNEAERISREWKEFGETTKYKGYNNKEDGRAFELTEFAYIKDINEELYNEIIKLAKDGKLSEIPSEKVKDAIRQYLNEGISRYIDNLEKFGIIYKKDGELLSNYMPNNFFGTEGARYGSIKEAISEHYLNDYIMSNSLNELLDGDYAISRKDKTDISKRNKGAMGSGNSYGSGTHRVSYIKSINSYVIITPENGNLQRVDSDEEILEKTGEDGIKYEYIVRDGVEKKVAKIETNDAQSYQSIAHKIYSLHALGRLDNKVWDIYKKILKTPNRNNVAELEITNDEQGYLESNKASLNPDKTVTFGMGIYHKTSEHSLDRGVISYIELKDSVEFDRLTDELIDLLDKRTFDKDKINNITKQLVKLYKPMPGMEYQHNVANQMDIHGIDQVIVESASKGATLMPVDSREDGFNLSNSMVDVLNEYKRLQVETPTGKDQITDGSQLIQLIDSEQDDKMIVNISGKPMSLGEVRKEYRSLMSESRKNSFKAAMTYIKDVEEGKVDISKLNAKLIRALVDSGADESLLELFSKPYNFNMVNMVDKAEQIALAHFSKGVLAQKVNGTKVSLVSGAGVDVVVDENDNVITYQVVAKNPAKYKNYKKRELAHNKKDKDGRVFSECILSERVLTKHGLEVGDEIPKELLEGMGYRIPTDDKHSMIAIKIVGLLPKTMEGVGIFPQEIIHLSGADFDIDSEFIQLHDYWMKDGKSIKYGSETTLEDKWDAFIYYKLNRDNEFKIEFNKNLELTNDRNMSIALALKEFGLPMSIEEFSKKEKPELLNNGVINNMVLDRRIAMLTNEKMLEDIAYTATSTDRLKNVSNRIETLKVKNSKYKISDKNISASDINGKFDANVKNSAGKNGIGVVANKIQNFNFLAKVDSKIKEDGFKYMIGGYIANGYSYVNKVGDRVSDLLGTGLQIMTDNAKDPIAGRLGLSMDLLAGWTELIAQGLPEYEASLLINLPALQIYSENKKISSYSLKNDVEKSITKSKTLKYTISKILDIDSKLVTNEMISGYKENMKDVSTKDMEGIISGEITDPVQLQEIQINALLQFSEVEKYSDLLSNINTLLRLNQGLDTSFIDLQQRLNKSIDDLGLVVNYENDQPVSIGVNREMSLPIDIEKALDADKLTYDNTLRAFKVLERGGKIFISQTNMFKKSMNQMKDILGASFASKAGSMREIGRSMLGYIATKAYRQLMINMINDPSVAESIKEAYAKRLDNINNRLIYKGLDGETLGQQLTELKNSPNSRISENSLIRYLQSTPDEDGILDLVSSKSFVKESPETISILLDSFKDLYNNKETRDFAINMFNYLIVKDNLEFKSGSFVKFVAPFMFDKLSQALDVTLDEFNKKDNVQEKKTLGDTFGKIAYDFRKSFATHVGNQYKKIFYRVLEGKEGWAKDVDGNITFNSRNADGTSNDKARNYLESIFETESQEYVSKKTGETGAKIQFVFPQFAMFNKVLYELVSYKEFDKTKFHDLTESKHVGTSANYAPLEFVGNKKVSPYPLGYESNVESSLLQKKSKEQSEYEDVEPDQIPPDDFEDDSFIDAALNKQSKNAQVGNIGSESIKFDEAKLPTQPSTSVAEQAKPKNKYSLSSDVASELDNEKLQESEKKTILSTDEDIIKSNDFKDFLSTELINNPDKSIKEILKYFKKCKLGK